ncbi:MAG TPA: glycosyltransferase [Candidatus Obscuribacterales bacterium]
MRSELPCRILLGPLAPTLELEDGRLINSCLTPDLCLGAYRHHPQLRGFYLDPQVLLRPGQRARPLPPGTLTLGGPSGWKLADLWARLGDWQPELLIWWGFHYALPADIADCPVPSLLVVADWHYHYTAVRAYLDAFDHVCCDRLLLQTLQARGYANASYWPAYGFDPGMLQADPFTEPYSAPGADHDQERDIDICFLGNVNPNTYPQRNRLLRQLAGLQRPDGRPWRIVIRHQVGYPHYPAMLRRSKIVFNHGLRREMNLRAYEAAACGALLLMEEDNLEVRDFLPGACVLYNEQNLTERVSYYLEHASEREAIARRGQELIQAHCYEAQFERLLEILPNIVPNSRRPAQRDEASRTLLEARQLVTTEVPSLRARALEVLENLPEDALADPRVLNALAVCRLDYESLLATAEHDYLPRTEPRELATRLSVIEPVSDPVTLNNRAWIAFGLQDWDALAVVLPLLAKGLAAEPVIDPDDFVLPLRFTPLHLRRQLLRKQYETEPQQLHAWLLRLLRWNCCYLQGNLLLARRDLPGAAAAFWQACQIAPELAESWLELGRCLQALQQLPEATAALSEGLQQGVYYPGAWLMLIQLLIKRGETSLARRHLAEARVLFQDPVYTGLLKALEPITGSLEQAG